MSTMSTINLKGIDYNITEHGWGTLTLTPLAGQRDPQIDPCQSPDGCPDLEPWMAYVGKGPLKMAQVDTLGFIFTPAFSGKSWGVGEGRGNNHYAIDVRTYWAQDNFPDHCRIRDYQKPDAFDEWWAKQNCVSVPNEPNLIWKCHAAYELGQENPKK